MLPSNLDHHMSPPDTKSLDKVQDVELDEKCLPRRTVSRVFPARVLVSVPGCRCGEKLSTWSNMVKEKKGVGCGDPIVNRIFNDPAIGFRAVDAHVKKVFYKRHIESLESTFKWMMSQKEIAKRIICEESGREVLPKTPSRNNPLALVTPSLAALKSDFMVEEVSGFTNEEGSHRDTWYFC
ncbi:unnamed protein product [Toxocara canis]|uniref:Uncharacterized protein n=1 Tax=Toxocara canis TaxID=6265 RepID=A0A183URW6_TOXCA|nr:unnamed protein product [Toxocara canis]